jgi:hypothetical protein
VPAPAQALPPVGCSFTRRAAVEAHVHLTSNRSNRDRTRFDHAPLPASLVAMLDRRLSMVKHIASK